MTGESVPVEKAVGSTDEPAADQLAAGTIVVRGRGVAPVTATGPNSSIGRLAALLDTGPQITPLQRRLSSLSRILALIAAILCISVAVIGLLRGEPLQLMAVTAISLAVAAVPESLPAVITLSLAIGARRMAARHAIVRRLPAVETLGSVSVIASDKTGTITEGAWWCSRFGLLSGRQRSAARAIALTATSSGTDASFEQRMLQIWQHSCGLPPSAPTQQSIFRIRRSPRDKYWAIQWRPR